MTKVNIFILPLKILCLRVESYNHYSKWVAVLLPALLLLPFINKAFHIDDTVYLYMGQHIQQSPFDFFGFQMNWDKEVKWLYDFNKNPPLLSYYLALVTLLVGWSELGIHLAILPFTMMASYGIYKLASLYCEKPLLATIISVSTPGFLVSSSNVMCEPMMVCFYVWAIYFWIQGMKTERKQFLLISSLMIVLGTLTKYVVITAIPLLIAYTILKERKFTTKLFFLFIPIGFIVAYDIYSIQLYGKSLMLDIVDYSVTHRTGTHWAGGLKKTAIGLSFLGGCFISVTLFAPFIYPKRILMLLVAIFLLIPLIAMITFGFDNAYEFYNTGTMDFSLLTHVSLFMGTGVYIMVLTIYDCWESRNAESVLLLLLVLGIFVFSTFLNWTINARTLILVAPAVGILAIRASEHQKVTYTRALIIPIAFSVLLSLVVVYADYAYADTGRKAATRLQPIFAGAEKEVLFEGHWGYQYYMEKKGYSHIDLGMPEDENPKDEVSQGLDLSVFGIQAQDMITGWKPHQLLDLSPKRMKDYQEYPIEGFRWLSLMNKNDGTGFYEASFGHLPYRFGRVEPEIFYVYTIKFTESLER